MKDATSQKTPEETELRKRAATVVFISMDADVFLAPKGFELYNRTIEMLRKEGAAA